jgi:methyl-accepting chemotaxis protein
MKNVKLMAKLIGGFSIVALITLIIGFVGWKSVNDLDENLLEISEVRLPSIKYLLGMSWHMEDMIKVQRTLLDPNLDMTSRKELYKEFSEAQKHFEAEWGAFEPLPQTQKEAQLWKDFVAAWQEVKKGNETFLRCAETWTKQGSCTPWPSRPKWNRSGATTTGS